MPLFHLYFLQALQVLLPLSLVLLFWVPHQPLALPFWVPHQPLALLFWFPQHQLVFLPI
jgi:hypothetical protein